MDSSTLRRNGPSFTNLNRRAMKPVCREGNLFRQDICIPCYQTDGKTLLKPASFMDLAQEIAYWAAQELGFGYDTLHIHHTAWVLSRMHIRFCKPVEWREQVRLYTWHKGACGLFYLRDFELRNASGETSIAATSSWVVIDEQTRRMVRPEDMAQTLETTGGTGHALEEPAPRLALPRGTEAQPAGEHTVVYSDVDIIGHTNNARYVVWAMDCLPPGEADKPLNDLYINFNKETKAGETVQLFRLREGNAWYVEGRLDGKPCFVVKMDFHA